MHHSGIRKYILHVIRGLLERYSLADKLFVESV
jgi:hypothetical protein